MDRIHFVPATHLFTEYYFYCYECAKNLKDGEKLPVYYTHFPASHHCPLGHGVMCMQTDKEYVKGVIGAFNQGGGL